MKLRYRLFRRRSGIFFLEDRLNRKQESLKTRDKTEATRILHARNEATQQPAINLQIARAYLMASDPLVAKRTWDDVMEAMIKLKHGPTRERYERARKEKPMERIRRVRLIETQAEHFLATLEAGTVSTNVHLRKLHNFALGMNWLPTPVIPRRQWPEVVFKEKRAITREEHERIVAHEGNRERRDYYWLCWHLGASQSDIANLKAEDVDWENKTIGFFRKKTGVPVVVHLGREALNLLKDLPSQGPLFPHLSRVRSGDRATEFKQRCRALGIEGVSLHSYRYAWAERAKCCGYYAAKLVRQGRRSTGQSTTDVMSPRTQIAARCRVESLDQPIAGEAEGDDLCLHDVLAGHSADPAAEAAKRLDWAPLVESLDTLARKVLHCLMAGEDLTTLVPKLKRSRSSLQNDKDRLARLAIEHLGADILTEVQRLPRWQDSLVASRERLACRYARSLA